MKRVCCPLCGVDNSVEQYSSTRSEPDIDANTVYRCTSPALAKHGPIERCLDCGMVYANPQPEDTDFMTAYRDVEDPDYLEQSRGRELTYARVLVELDRFVKPPGKLLDIGCYTGVFLKIAAETGWNVEGIEPSEWAACITRRAGPWTVHNCALQEAKLTPASFDIISLWDVIEHLPRPCDALRSCAEILRPGGILALGTHLLDSLAPRLMGTKYPFLMDMHPVHFTHQTISRALVQAGFEVLAITPHRRIVMLAYLLERLGHVVPFSGPLLRLLLRIPKLDDQAVTVRGVGLFNVYARKP